MKDNELRGRGGAVARRGKARLHETHVEQEVAFYDVDQMGVVWHGNYFRYFDVARSRMMRGLGLEPGSGFGGEFHFMVSESKCRHIFPLRYGDRFRVSAWLSDIKHRLNVQFEIHNLERDCRSATGHTMLVCLDAEGRMVLRTPQGIVDRLTKGTAARS